MTYADLIFKLYEQIVNLTKENEKLRQELEATKKEANPHKATAS